MRKIVVFVLLSMLFFTGCDWLLVESGGDSGGSSVSTSTCVVTEIKFLDSNGQSLNNSTWDSIWSTTGEYSGSDIDAYNGEEILNDFFGYDGWFVSKDTGLISIIPEKQKLLSAQLNELVYGLDTYLDNEINNNLFYDFSASYAKDSKIYITFETTDNVGVESFNALQMDSSGAQMPIVVRAKKVTDIVDSTKAMLYQRIGSEMVTDDIEYIATTFDSMYMEMTTTYGNHTDIDNNGKVIILLYDINKNLDSSGGYIAGYFSPNDLNGSSYGNNAEVLYVESQVQNDIENIFGTVIHEFQHLINWNMNVVLNDRQSDLWLNEALSAASEILVLDVQDENDFGPIMPYNRLYTYASGSAYGGLHESIRDGNYFYSWDYYDPNKVYADYATVSLFMYWITLYYDYSTIESIAQASANVRGTYEAVVEAFNVHSKVTEPVEWENIMASWLLDNEFGEVTFQGDNKIYRGYRGGLAGYFDSNVLNTSPVLFPSKIHSGNKKNVRLAPGDAVLTRSQITNASGETDYHLGVFDLSEKFDTYITINRNKEVFLEDHPEVGVTIPASIMSRSVQETALPPPPKVTNRIIPFSHIIVDENEGR